MDGLREMEMSLEWKKKIKKEIRFLISFFRFWEFKVWEDLDLVQ